MISARDTHDSLWSDTIIIDVVEDTPVILSVDSILSINLIDTIHAVVNDQYGEIVLYEWDLDGDGMFEKETHVPFVVLNNENGYAEFVALRVTDDDNNQQKTSIFNTAITSANFAEFGNLPNEIDSITLLRNRNDAIYVVDKKKQFWKSYDAKSWLQLSPMTEDGFNTVELIWHDNQMWAVNIQEDTVSHSDDSIDIVLLLKKTTDEVSWDTVVVVEDTVHKGFIPLCLSFNNKIFTSFTDEFISSNGYFTNIYSTTDGTNWTLLHADAWAASTDGDNVYVAHAISDNEVHRWVSRWSLMKELWVESLDGDFEKKYILGDEQQGFDVFYSGEGIKLDSLRSMMYVDKSLMLIDERENEFVELASFDRNDYYLTQLESRLFLISSDGVTLSMEIPTIIH